MSLFTYLFICFCAGFLRRARQHERFKLFTVANMLTLLYHIITLFIITKIIISTSVKLKKAMHICIKEIIHIFKTIER